MAQPQRASAPKLHRIFYGVRLLLYPRLQQKSSCHPLIVADYRFTEDFWERLPSRSRVLFSPDKRGYAVPAFEYICCALPVCWDITKALYENAPRF